MMQMELNGEEAMMNALCVSILHIIVIIFRLRLAFSEERTNITQCVLIQLLVVTISG